MKSTIATVAILALFGLVVGVGAIAATEATVSATVTSQLVAITVADGNVAYGILPVNTNADTVTLGQTQVVTNGGNVNVDLSVKSSDAVGRTNWNLAATNAALNEFTHEFSSNSGVAYTGFNVDNITYISLVAGVIPTGTQNLDLKIKTPASVTDNAQKAITITVLATAS